MITMINLVMTALVSCLTHAVELESDHYDAIIVGTGLAESIAAA